MVRSWKRLHHPVELEGKQGDTMIAAFLGAPGGEIFASGEPEMIGPQVADTVVPGVCQPRNSSALANQVWPDSTNGPFDSAWAEAG